MTRQRSLLHSFCSRTAPIYSGLPMTLKSYGHVRSRQRHARLACAGSMRLRAAQITAARQASDSVRQASLRKHAAPPQLSARASSLLCTRSPAPRAAAVPMCMPLMPDARLPSSALRSRAIALLRLIFLKFCIGRFGGPRGHPATMRLADHPGCAKKQRTPRRAVRGGR